MKRNTEIILFNPSSTRNKRYSINILQYQYDSLIQKCKQLFDCKDRQILLIYSELNGTDHRICSDRELKSFSQQVHLYRTIRIVQHDIKEQSTYQPGIFDQINKNKQIIEQSISRSQNTQIRQIDKKQQNYSNFIPNNFVALMPILTSLGVIEPYKDDFKGQLEEISLSIAKLIEKQVNDRTISLINKFE